MLQVQLRKDLDLNSDDVRKPAPSATAQTCLDLLPGQDPINAPICLAGLSWVSGALKRPLLLPLALFFPTTDSLASGPGLPQAPESPSPLSSPASLPISTPLCTSC